MFYKTYKKIHIAVDVLRLYCAGIRDEYQHDFALTVLDQILEALSDEDFAVPADPEDSDDADDFLPEDYDDQIDAESKKSQDALRDEMCAKLKDEKISTAADALTYLKKTWRVADICTALGCSSSSFYNMAAGRNNALAQKFAQTFLLGGA